jgi:hypothetical protein
MNEWREKVARASCRAAIGECHQWDLDKRVDDEWRCWLPQADAAIAELLPLLKAKLANDLRDKHDGRLVSRMAIAAAIESWEPQHD